MEKTTVEITVKNQNYTIISDEPEENVIALANELTAALDTIMSSGRISLNQGLVLACLDFADKAKKSTALAEKYKAEIADYLQDSEIAKTERDKYKREYEKLKDKLSRTGNA